MKYINYLFLLFFIQACTKSAESGTENLKEQVSATAVVHPQTMPGVFVSDGERVSETATVYNQNGQLTLALENFSSNNGPDLHVYLSQELQPVHFIDLGKFKSISGNQLYEISGMPDFKSYQWALIHCL